MLRLMRTLYPIARSLSGNGNRETLNILREHIPLDIHEIPSGLVAYDWEIPKEWNVNAAYIKNSKGEIIVDWAENNLHLMGYSTPVSKTITLNELKQHLYTLPEHPDWIPYVTTYYNEKWGFCLSHNQMLSLPDDLYQVFIDTTLVPGSITYGEFFLQGKTQHEFLISTYICHPSLCNDNLSGVVLSTFLAKNLLNMPLRYSYRFLFLPETIGSIAWLSSHEGHAKKWIKWGLVATCLGDGGQPTYKRSRNANSTIDKVVEYILRETGRPYKTVDFYPFGSDERQYSSPGFNLPVGSLMRTPYSEYPEYHTSADNLEFMSESSLNESLQLYLRTIDIIERNRKFINVKPMCEPKLGNYGLYTSGNLKPSVSSIAYLNLLNWSDGRFDLVDIALKSGISFDELYEASCKLCACGLLSEVDVL